MASLFSGRDPFVRLSDNELLQRARQGDREALFALWGRYEHLVRRLAFRAANNRDEGEELFARVRAKALEALPKLPRGFTSAWLVRVVKTSCSDMHRQNSRYVSTRTVDSDGEVCDLLETTPHPMRSTHELACERLVAGAVRSQIDALRHRRPKQADALYQRLALQREFADFEGDETENMWRTHYRRGRLKLTRPLIWLLEGDDPGGPD